jgi:hypothetical protein
VVFPLPEGRSGDEVLADLHEEWLEAAPSAESAAGSSVADRT